MLVKSHNKEMLAFADSACHSLLLFSGLTSTSWVIAVSSDDGENDGGGATHTQRIHNEHEGYGMGQG